MNGLDFKGAAGELAQAADYLRATGSPKVGYMGRGRAGLNPNPNP